MFGLAALFNSALLDRYFRIISGNTQVNATEIRSIKFPQLDQVAAIGERLKALGNYQPAKVERIVLEALGINGAHRGLSDGSGVVSKVDEAVAILAALGLPHTQQNERSALTLLALAKLGPMMPGRMSSGHCFASGTSWGSCGKSTGRITRPTAAKRSGARRFTSLSKPGSLTGILTIPTGRRTAAKLFTF